MLKCSAEVVQIVFTTKLLFFFFLNGTLFVEKVVTSKTDEKV